MQTESRSRIKKKPELSEYFQIDNYLDVYCTQSKIWRVARIVDIKDKEIEVNYDGTAKKLNELIKVTSSKLAFCRRFTQGTKQ
jgi:N-methylhydantoinase B/oxoprolinase/acetone carboxylase alpha subunit